MFSGENICFSKTPITGGLQPGASRSLLPDADPAATARYSETARAAGTL